MTSIAVDDHVAKSLEEFAQAMGLTVGDYLAFVIRQVAQRATLSADDVVALIDAESGPGNPDYRGTFTREEIYED